MCGSCQGLFASAEKNLNAVLLVVSIYLKMDVSASWKSSHHYRNGAKKKIIIIKFAFNIMRFFFRRIGHPKKLDILAAL